MSPENLKTLGATLPANTSLTHFMDFRCGHDDLEALMNAVRAEERAKAVEVVRPFADVADAFEDESWAEDDAVSIECQDWVVDNTKITVGDFRRAAAYITDNEGGA